MNQAVADIIRNNIENLDFVDKIAGLVSTQIRDERGPDNTVVQKAYPVACCVSAEDCKDGAYNELMPDSQYKTVIYFEDQGVNFIKYESNWKYYVSNLRLVCWINIEKLIESGVCKSEVPCTYAAHIIAEIIRALPSHPRHFAPFTFVYSEIENQVTRSAAIFSAYTYDEKHSQYLMAPYDYFALDIRTNFAVCLKNSVVYDATCDSGDDIDESGNYIGYGALYNWYAAAYSNFSVSIAPPGWHVPTLAEWWTLILTLDPAATLGQSLVAGGMMKEAGLAHWLTPNTGATNSSGFNAMPSGGREGPFVGYGSGVFSFALADNYNPIGCYVSGAMAYNNAKLQGIGTSQLKWYGNPVRLIKDDSIDTGVMTDIDNNSYPTVKIGNQVWMASNLKVEHFNNGALIPNVTDDAVWMTLTTPAVCYYPIP